MRFVKHTPGLILAMCVSASVLAQAEGEVQAPGAPQAQTQIRTVLDDLRLHLDYGVFDPLQGAPVVPGALASGNDTNLYIVQFDYAFIDADRDALRSLGGKLHSPLPNNALIVRMDATQAAKAASLDGVRWVGPFHPAYRLEPELRSELLSGRPMPTRKYNMVMADKRNDKAALEDRIEGIGGVVTDRHDRGLLMTAELTPAQLVQAARLDEVLWIDRWTEIGFDMNNARALQGTNHVETAIGYTAAGVNGHVYEGVEYDHPDFTYAMTNVLSGGQADRHGHCTAGCIFGNGTSTASARGHAPGARGFYTNAGTVTTGYSRNAVIDAVVNTHNCWFTTASWGGGLTTAYTSLSADADDIVFDHRIPWTQSQSNDGTQLSRPEAWAKNVISVGGYYHNNNQNMGDDLWGGGGSVGPAADTRIKPDLSNFYDDVLCSDLTGTAGYSTGNYTTGFGGTSAATPITAGLNAIAASMYANALLGNVQRVPGGTRFENRPYAQTMKALQIACATMHPFGTGTGQMTRYRGGWGTADVGTIYDNRANLMIIPEDHAIEQGETHTYWVDVDSGEPVLKVCMTYLDPAGNVAATYDRINNLNLRVFNPSGTVSYWGNNGLTSANTSTSGGTADTRDTVECVFVNNPTAGLWRVEVSAPTIAQDAHTGTSATDAVYALVALGGQRGFAGCARYFPDENVPSTGSNLIPFGTSSPSTLTSQFAGGYGVSAGGAVYFDITPTTNLYLHGFDMNLSATLGDAVAVDVYTRSGTHAGHEASTAGWSARQAGHGTAAGANSPTRIDLNGGIYMAANVTYGVAVVGRNTGINYSGGANTFSNSDLSWVCGASNFVAFSSTVFSPRTMDMTLRYQRDEATWHNQKYQMILRHSELGGAGNITGLAFVPTTSGRHYNRVLRIRMANVSRNYAMTTDFGANIGTNYTTVLNEVDHVVHMEANEWNEIGLEAPFAYNGSGDVVVEIMARGNHQQVGSTGGFRPDLERERLFDYGWPFAAEPTTGTLSGGSGLLIRANFNCAEASMFATACGTVRAVPYSTPVTGTPFWFDIYGKPNSGALIVLGFNRNAPYPYKLDNYGFTNCFTWNEAFGTSFVPVGATGHAWFQMNLPTTHYFDGLTLYGHWVNLDPVEPGGATFSNYIRMVIGAQNP